MESFTKDNDEFSAEAWERAEEWMKQINKQRNDTSNVRDSALKVT